jgi:hypothetical protein
MRSAIVLVLLGACAGSYSEADVRHLEEGVGDANTRRMATALDHAFAQKDLKEVDAPFAQSPVAKLRWDGASDVIDVQESYGYASIPGMTALEQLGTEVLDDGSDGRRVLVIKSDGGGCGGVASTAYHFGQDDAGHMWLVRLHIQWQYRTVHQSGSCGYGCGTEPPPGPTYLYAVPAGWVGFLDEDVVQEEINVTCDHMIPVP